MHRVRRLAHHLPERPQLPPRTVAVIVLAGLLLGGGWLVLRSSSLVQINRVDVIGLSSSEAAQVRDALTDSARSMTTLNLDEGTLRAAVERFPSVEGLRAQTDFPHGVSIEVYERAPVALLDLGSQKIPVGAGGRLMRGVKARDGLPVLPARTIVGDRLQDTRALESVNILAAAPPSLRQQISKVWIGAKGQMLELRNGPVVFFGSAGRPVAKWMATARVLAEPSAAGAVYLDVRVPERVAAGGLGTAPTETLDPLSPSGTGQIIEPQVEGESDPTLNP